MRKPKMHGNHKCAPSEWKKTSDMTGSYEVDGAIARNPNKDMTARLEDHLVSDQPYANHKSYGKS